MRPYPFAATCGLLLWFVSPVAGARETRLELGGSVDAFGTYIRAIARDLGAALQTFGTLTSLTRTQSSGFDLENSLTLEQLEAQLQQNTFQPVLPDEVLEHLEAIALSPILAKRARRLTHSLRHCAPFH